MGHSVLHIPYFSSTPILLCGHNDIEVRPPRRNDNLRTSNISELIAKLQPWNILYKDQDGCIINMQLFEC